MYANPVKHPVPRNPRILTDLSPDRRTTLICLPYAGGSTRIFRRWKQWLTPDVEVRPIELPGHGVRLRVAPNRRMEPLIESLLPKIAALSESPYAFFGHGTGALIAYALALRLAADSRPPAHLFVSASRAPHCPNDKALENLARDCRRAMGPAFEDPEDPVRRALEADLEIDRHYRPSAVPLDCPVTIFGGAGDDSLSVDQLNAWSQISSRTGSVQFLPGGYLFIHEHERLLTLAIQRVLERFVASTTAENTL